MKRFVLLLSLAILGAAAVLAAPRYLQARERAQRYAEYKQRMGYDKPLVLDAATQAILTHADKVETFLLFGRDDDETPAEMASLHGPHPQYLNDHSVIGVGPVQEQAFGTALQAALGKGSAEPDNAGCFEPRIGFRAWKGQAHTDICVCFSCQGVEIVTKDAKHAVVSRSLTVLGNARPALLALSRQAFPQDKRLAAVPDRL